MSRIHKMTPKPAFQDVGIEWVYSQYPEEIQKKCLVLRQWVFEVAADDPAIGSIDETLRWGEPSYIPSQTKSGTMVRIHHSPKKGYDFGMYFLCQTDLVSRFKLRYNEVLKFEGNRAIIFNRNDTLPMETIKKCVLESFRYYLS